MSNLTTFNEITLKEITTPTAVANHGKIYTKVDNIPYFQSGAGSESALLTTAGIVYSHMDWADPGSNYFNRKTRNIAGTGSNRFNFHIPRHYTGTLKVELIGYAASGAPGVGKDIDRSGEYTTDDGNDNQQYTFSDTTSTFTVPTINQRWALDCTSLLINIAPGTEGGIFIDHNNILTTVAYLGLRVTSTP